MSIYSVSGAELSALYDVRGTSLTQAYDVSGNELISGDYDRWDTEYQHTILQARDAWAAEYRADDTIIPVIIHTDQHRYLNAAHKPTFDYLARAVKWDEVSAIIGLGDVCGAVYNTTDLNNMLTCLSSLPRAKRIDVAGNHDAQLDKAEGSSYAYAPMTNELFHTLQDTYFNNSQFGGNNSNVRYGYKGMETVIDPLHHIRFCIFAVWETGSAPDYYGNPWYAYRLTPAAAEAMIAMLSAVDDLDIVVLSHIQPYHEEVIYHKPAVDGGEAYATTEFSKPGHLGYSVSLDRLYADRKAKRAGVLVDVEGNEHPYDFSRCTSDLLCSLSGHSHTDYFLYSPDGTMPAVVFDAYRYDNRPLFFVNIDRTKQRLNVWKFDEANQIYNYQVPFLESGMESGEGVGA